MNALPPMVGALGLAAPLLGGGELGRRDPLHAGDLAVARPVSSFCGAIRHRRTGATGRATRGDRRGVLGTALAIVSESIADVLTFFYTLLSVSLFVPVVAGLYLRRVTSPEALGAIASGVALLIVVQVGTAGQGVAGLTPAMLGLGAALIGCSVVATFRSTTGLRGVS